VQGKGAGLVLQRCTTEAMSLHRAEISQAVAPGAHVVLLFDRAGWHVSRKLKVPSNITLLPLPRKAPELNPVENIWRFMRENWLSNRVFTSYTDILDHCCAPGISSSPNLGPSCPSACATGPMREDQRRLVRLSK